MTIEFKQTIPILRIFDVQKAMDFYGAKCVEVIDPFGNRVRFNEKIRKQA